MKIRTFNYGGRALWEVNAGIKDGKRRRHRLATMFSFATRNGYATVN